MLLFLIILCELLSKYWASWPICQSIRNINQHFRQSAKPITTVFNKNCCIHIIYDKRVCAARALIDIKSKFWKHMVRTYQMTSKILKLIKFSNSESFPNQMLRNCYFFPFKFYASQKAFLIFFLYKKGEGVLNPLKPMLLHCLAYITTIGVNLK